MQAATNPNPPSLPQILYALILALTPFLESLLAEAARQGRPPSPTLRRLACTLRALRAVAAVFGKPGTEPHTQTPATPPNRPNPCATTRDAIRRHIRASAQTPQPPRAATPEPARTLEL